MCEKVTWLVIALLRCIFTRLWLVKIWPHTRATISSHLPSHPSNNVYIHVLCSSQSTTCLKTVVPNYFSVLLRGCVSSCAFVLPVSLVSACTGCPDSVSSPSQPGHSWSSPEYAVVSQGRAWCVHVCVCVCVCVCKGVYIALGVHQH